MIATEPLVIFYQKWEQAVPRAEQQLTRAGFEPLRTFDLQVARAGRSFCPCPHHGTDQCDCQMMVLLVFGKDGQPLSLVVHGHDDITWFYVVDTPQQHADARLLALIRQELAPPEPPTIGGESVTADKTDQTGFPSTRA
jgi:hypothetical protein